MYTMTLVLTLFSLPVLICIYRFWAFNPLEGLFEQEYDTLGSMVSRRDYRTQKPTGYRDKVSSEAALGGEYSAAAARDSSATAKPHESLHAGA